MADRKDRKPDGKSAPSGMGASIRSWLGTVVGVFAVFALAVAGVALLAHYLKQRPVDMTGLSAAVAEETTKALAESDIPADCIRADEPQLERSSDGKVLWLNRVIDVRVPADIGMDALEKRLAEVMATRSVRVVRKEESPSARLLKVGMGEYEFVNLALSSPLPPVSTLPDLKAAAKAVADVVDAFLSRCELGPVAWSRDAGTPQEDANASWLLTRFTVPIDGINMVLGVASRLEPLLNGHNVAMRIRPGKGDRSHLLTIAHGGAPFVEVEFTGSSNAVLPRRTSPAPVRPVCSGTGAARTSCPVWTNFRWNPPAWTKTRSLSNRRPPVKRPRARRVWPSSSTTAGTVAKSPTKCSRWTRS